MRVPFFFQVGLSARAVAIPTPATSDSLLNREVRNPRQQHTSTTVTHDGWLNFTTPIFSGHSETSGLSDGNEGGGGAAGGGGGGRHEGRSVKRHQRRSVRSRSRHEKIAKAKLNVLSVRIGVGATLPPSPLFVEPGSH